MIDKIDYLNLIDGLNMNPISLETGNEMTTSKWLMAIQSKVNEIINMRNTVLSDANSYTDVEVGKVKKLLDELKVLLNNGEIIPNGSVGLEKLTKEFFDKVENVVVDSVHDVAQFVTFGLNDEGYFVASVPSAWNEIKFDTDIEGRLTLSF